MYSIIEVYDRHNVLRATLYSWSKAEHDAQFKQAEALAWSGAVVGTICHELGLVDEGLDKQGLQAFLEAPAHRHYDVRVMGGRTPRDWSERTVGKLAVIVVIITAIIMWLWH